MTKKQEQVFKKLLDKHFKKWLVLGLEEEDGEGGTMHILTSANYNTFERVGMLEAALFSAKIPVERKPK
jgi:hypothetical protein